MNRIFTLLSTVSLMVVVNAYAASPKAKITDFTDMQKSYYELGKEDAKKIYFYKGYQKALADFSTLLEKYKNKIKALEAGKYLIEEGKITYPEVYKMQADDGSYKIIIDTPTVSRDFSYNDLFIIPLKKNANASSHNEKQKMASTNSDESKDINNNFSFFSDSPERANTSSPINLSSFDKKEISVTINGKNSEVRKILDSNGVKYAETPSGYKIFFNSLQQKETFCKNLTGNKSCS